LANSWNRISKCANREEVARQLGMTTTTLYDYVNGDGSLKQAGQALFDRDY